MILNIHDDLSVEDLQDRFSLCFPHLKMEFYRKPHHWGASSPDNSRIDPKSRIGDISKKHYRGQLEIKSWDAIGKVETELRERFGLYVQIFRKENGDWIQTTSTDSSSLKEQTDLREHTKNSILQNQVNK